MEITIRYTEDCPNADVAEERVRRVLRNAGINAAVSREVVLTEKDAMRLGFTGSPTILIDGRDLFGDPSARPALACRLYVSADGRRDVAPSIHQITEAIGGG